jgi:hypothetical protein
VLPRPHKIAVITGGILLVTAALLVMWDGVVAAYVL